MSTAVMRAAQREAGGRIVAILPALYTVNQLESVLLWAEVIVLMKVSSVYAKIWQILDRHQLLAHSYVVENATKPNQITYTGIQNHPHLKLPYFSLMIIKNTTGPSMG